MCRMWFLTVWMLRCSSSAICTVECPRSSSPSTSFCRTVSARCGGGGSDSSMSRAWPKTPITWPPLVSGTALTSAANRLPSASIATTLLSEPAGEPIRFRVKISSARRLSSGATTEVRCLPRTSPSLRFAAGFSQRMTPCRSMTYAGTLTRSIASSTSPPIAPRSDMASARTKPPHRRGLRRLRGERRRQGLCRCQRLLLDGVVLGVGDRTLVEQCFRLLDLRRRAAAAGRVADVVVELRLLRLLHRQAARRHSLALSDQVDEHAQVRDDEGEDEPTHFHEAGNVVSAEQVAPDAEQHPEPGDPEEEDENRPHRVQERVARSQHPEPPEIGYAKTARTDSLQAAPGARRPTGMNGSRRGRATRNACPKDADTRRRRRLSSRPARRPGGWESGSSRCGPRDRRGVRCFWGSISSGRGGRPRGRAAQG